MNTNQSVPGITAVEPYLPKAPGPQSILDGAIKSLRKSPEALMAIKDYVNDVGMDIKQFKYTLDDQGL